MIVACFLLVLLALAGPVTLFGHYLMPTVREKREIKQNFRDIRNLDYVPEDWREGWFVPADF